MGRLVSSATSTQTYLIPLTGYRQIDMDTVLAGPVLQEGKEEGPAAVAQHT